MPASYIFVVAHFISELYSNYKFPQNQSQKSISKQKTIPHVQIFTNHVQKYLKIVPLTNQDQNNNSGK